MTKLTCQKCHYTWTPKKPGILPKECPQCKSRNWLAKLPKTLVGLLVLAIMATACAKHPDSPAPQAAATPAQPKPQLPPVSNCQGATVPITIPTYVQNDNTSQATVIPGFDVGCGDTVQVLIKNILLAPSDPWTTLTSNPLASSNYSVSGQTITVNVHTGNTLYVAISAILY